MQDLQFYRMIPHDGSSYELGKQGHIQRHIQWALLGWYISPVYIDDIAQRLECKEGNANGQSQIQYRHNLFSHHVVQIGHGEVPVFKHK